jgi:hypothetical protein
MKARIIFYGLLVSAAYIFLSSLAGSRRAEIPLAQTDIANLAAALNQYHLELGEYPQGENASVLKALLGENSKNIKFFDANPKRFDSLGQFFDPWNTPYKIQIFGNTNFAVRSFGPNRIFDDKDDLTNLTP